MADKTNRVAIVFPADPKLGTATQLEESRFARTAEALAAQDLQVEGAPYSDSLIDEVRTQLLRVDGVLVWINPTVDGRDRSMLDAMLQEVGSTGVFVSAHPEVIARMGTKEVLYRTRGMDWGCDTRLYQTTDQMRTELPASLASGMPRVLKRLRGQSGDGVWKVEISAPGAAPSGTPVPPNVLVRLRPAARGNVEETLPLDTLMERWEPYFADGEGMIDQIYQPRLADGMVRCYLVNDRVAGFGEQLINALFPAAPGTPAGTAPPPGPRLYYPPTRPDFQRLKDNVEQEWLGELCRLVGVGRAELPILWDADFLYGAKDADGADTYVLCEINVSSVYPFPEDALTPLALATRTQLARWRN
jgi:hypothetical protein